MSRASLAVRFPNGTIRYGIYNGTSDIARPCLYEALDEAWANRHEPWPAVLPDAEKGIPVDIATNYGNGFWWTGSKATLEYIVSGYSPFDDAEEEFDRIPDWLPHWKDDDE